MNIQMLNCKPIINRLFSSVTYLITSNEGFSAWVVDPGDMDKLTPYLNNTHIYISGILLTHAHFDHIYGLNEIIALFPTAKVYTNEFGRRMLLNEKMNLSKYHNSPFIFSREDGSKIELDNEIKAQAIYTPGHNPSCITWIIKNSLFTGDSYIPGIKTVTNLPASNKEQARISEEKIKSLSDDKLIYPGHLIPEIPWHH